MVERGPDGIGVIRTWVHSDPLPPPPNDGAITYTVRNGDTLPELAVRYQVSPQQIQAANPQMRDEYLGPGQEISIPIVDNGGTLPTRITVANNDSLTQISAHHGVSLDQMIAANGISNPDLLSPGEQLWVPVAGTRIAPGSTQPNPLQPYVAAVDAAVAKYQAATGSAKGDAQAAVTQAVENEIRARGQIELPSGVSPNDSLLSDFGTSIAARYGTVPGLDQAVQQSVNNASAARSVDDALKQVDSAQQALHQASAHMPPEVRSELQQNVTDSENNLQSQMEAEIRTRSATPAGQVPDDATVQKYSAIILQRYGSRPAELAALQNAMPGELIDFKAEATDLKVEAVVSDAQSAGSQDQMLAKLNQDFEAATPDVQQGILKDSGAQAILQGVANQATAPLQEVAPNSNDPVAQINAFRETLKNLDQATSPLDPTLAAAVVAQALPQIEQYNSQCSADSGHSPASYSAFVGQDLMSSLMSLSGRIAGTAQGDQDVARLAALGFRNDLAITNALADGASVAYLQAFANQLQAAGKDPSYVISLIQGGVKGDMQRVQADVQALGGHNEELSWLINNLGKSMTPDQLQNAITTYEHQPDWQKKDTQLTQQLITDATTLTQNLKILGAVSQQNPQVASSLNLQGTITAAFNDPAIAYGLTLAAGQNPELYSGSQGEAFLTLLTELKLGDLGRKTTQLIGTMYVRNMISIATEPLKDGTNKLLPVDARIAQAEKILEDLKKPWLKNWMGVTDDTVWNKALQTFKDNLVLPGDSTDTGKAKLNKFDGDLNNLKALSASTPAGQLLRTIAVVYAFESTENSSQKTWLAKGSFDQTIATVQTLVGFAGLAQKVANVANGFGLIDSKGLFGKYASSFAKDGANGVISFTSALFDLIDAVRSFGGIGEKQDWAGGTFSALNGVGGSFYAASQFGETSFFAGLSEDVAGGTIAAGLGLAGVGLVAVGVLGKAFYQQYQNDHQYQGISKDFLQWGGYSSAAASALSSQDGLLSGAGGAAGMTFLARFGQMDNLSTTQLQSWINGLTSSQLSSLDTRLLQTAGDSHGDPQQFTNGPPQDVVIPDYSSGWASVITASNTLGVFENNLKADGVPLPP